MVDQQNPPPETAPAEPAPAVLPFSQESPQPTFPGQESRGFPLRKILVLLLVFVLLGAVGFGAFRFLGREKFQKEVNLTWWGLWEDPSIIQPLIDEYQTKFPDIKINYVRQSSADYRQRLNSALAKGEEGPDIFRFHNSWVPMLERELASLPPAVMDAQTFSKTFYPVAASDLAFGGKIVGIPLMFDGLGLYINEDLFNAAGVSPPTNWDELRRAAISLTVRDGAGKITQAGVALGTVGNVDHWQDIFSLMMLQNGADPDEPSGKRAEDALSFYTIFTTVDKVWDQTLPPSTSIFAAGRLGMYLAPSWRAFEIKAKNPGLKFHIIPVPQLPKSSPAEKDINWASYWVEGVWQQSEGKKEAFQFLKFLSEKEQLEKLYANQARTRLFGEPPPRRDMAALIADSPFVGAYIKGAETSHSGYLASRTFDGETGINSRVSKYFEDAINKMLTGNTPTTVLTPLQKGVSQVLSEYAK